MRRRGNRPEEKSPFDQYILDLARVTRVTEGGKHMSFRAGVIIGDRQGRVGFGLAKGKDVQLGVEKAVRQAKKNMITVPIRHETIPHPVYQKFKAARVMLKPAPKGSGIIAGGAVRAVLELAGVPNVSAKILAKTKNKIVIAKATFAALASFKQMPGNVAVAKRVLAEEAVSDADDEEETTATEEVATSSAKVSKAAVKKATKK